MEEDEISDGGQAVCFVQERVEEGAGLAVVASDCRGLVVGDVEGAVGSED